MMRGPPFASDRILRIAYCDHGPAGFESKPIWTREGHDKPPAIPEADTWASFVLGSALARVGSAARARTVADAQITIVVPFPPGGVADFAARPLAAHLADTLRQNVVVENKGGAGGGIGHAYVARAEPDGHTIMTALPSLAVIPEGNRLAGKPVPYEMDQFVPLARMLADPPILAVKNSSPWNSFKDFIAAVKAKPGQIPYGTSGHLGTVHLAMAMFLNAAQLKMVHVPYQGGGPSFNALLSGQVPVVPTPG